MPGPTASRRVPPPLLGRLTAVVSVMAVAGLGLVGAAAPASADEPATTVSADGLINSRGRLQEQTAPNGCPSYVVPAGVTEISVTVTGGHGNTGRSFKSHGGGVGGSGAVVTVDRIPVTAGQRIYTGVVPGGQPFFPDSTLTSPNTDRQDQPGVGGDAAWVAEAVDSSCTPNRILAFAGGGGGGGDADWNGPGGTGGDAGSRGNDGSGSGSGRAGKGGEPGTATAGGAGGAGGQVVDITCFCTTNGPAGTAGQSALLPTTRSDNGVVGRQTGGLGGQGTTGTYGLSRTWGGSGGAGYFGGGGGGASHGFSTAVDSSGPLAGAGSGGGGGGSSSPSQNATLTGTVYGSGNHLLSSVLVEARWTTTTTVTSSANPAQPGAPITLTATVASVNPFGSRNLTGGRVVFTDVGAGESGSTELATVPIVIGADGRATATLTLPGGLSGGSHRMRATFLGFAPFGSEDRTSYQLPSIGYLDQVVVDQQTLSFTSTPGSRAAYGDAYTPTARSTSNLPVTVTVDPSAASVCGIDPATAPRVSFFATGTCVLNADQAGSAAFFAAPRVQQSFTVAPGTPPEQQVITFTSTPPADPQRGSVYTVSAVGGGSGNPVTFQARSGAGSCFQVGANQIRIDGGGLCYITASQAAGPGFLAASATQELFVGPAPQAIEFRSTAPASLAVGATYTVVVAVDSRRLATFGTGPGSTGCTVLRVPPGPQGNATSSATVTATGPGRCVITAQEPTNDTFYTPSPVIIQTVLVGAQQSVAFTSAAPQDAVVGATLTPTTTGGGSGQPVVLSSTTPLTCSVTDGKVTLLTSGLCTLAADQAGTATFAPAERTTQSFVVARAAQTIAFTSTAPSGAVVGDTYTPALRVGPSSAPVTLVSTTPGTCAVSSGGVVTFTGAGTCTVAADQAGDDDHTAAPRVTQDVAVSGGAQTVAFTSTAPAAVVGGPTYTPTVSGGASTAPVVLGTTSPTSICTISGGVVTFTGAGTCTLTADQAADASYAAAPRVTQSVTVGKAAQTITFTSRPPAAPTTGVAYPLAATTTSGLPVTFTATGACTVTSTGQGTATVTLTGAAVCTVTATQAGDANRLAATPVRQTLQVPAGSRADLRVTVTPGSGSVPRGPLTMKVTVTNTGTRDSGATTTHLFVSAPVADAGGAVRVGGPAGLSTLTWKAPNISAGASTTYLVTIDPRPGLAGFSALTSGAAVDPTPLNNVVAGTYRR